MLSTGALIWISLRPLFRLVICTMMGFAITKSDIFPLVAARGAGQVLLNITIPSLMFSKIVPAFTSANIGALGPLVFVAVIYELMGIFIAWVVRLLFWVPHRFRYGILAAGGWGNWGDVPTAVIMSITAASPFNGAEDQTLSVAYISAFILVFFISLFPMGGHHLIAMDYSGPDVENDEVRACRTVKFDKFMRDMGMKLASIPFRIHGRGADSVREDSSSYESPVETKPTFGEISKGLSRLEAESGALSSEHRRVTFTVDDVTVVTTDPAPSRNYSPAQTAAPSRVTSPDTTDTLADRDHNRVIAFSPHPTPPETLGSPRFHTNSASATGRILARLIPALKSLLTPPALAIILAFPIALIVPLKALFTTLPPGSAPSPIPNAPDGQPPLAFILDTASFVGAASVPLGLVCLGSALARLKLPAWRTWFGRESEIPVGAILGLAVGKMVIMPIVGVVMVQGLVHAGFVDRDDKVLQFVCIFFSCVPTATTQVFLTQVYSGTGSADHLSAFLIPQYAIMFVSMTALTAYTLSILF